MPDLTTAADTAGGIPKVERDSAMSAKTMDEALAEEARRGDEHRAQIRAEGWRAGAEAMREMAAEMAAGFLMTKTALPVEKVVDCGEHIRSLDIPEMPNDR